MAGLEYGQAATFLIPPASELTRFRLTATINSAKSMWMVPPYSRGEVLVLTVVVVVVPPRLGGSTPSGAPVRSPQIRISQAPIRTFWPKPIIRRWILIGTLATISRGGPRRDLGGIAI